MQPMRFAVLAAFAWSSLAAQTIVTIDVPGAFNTSAYSINSFGDVSGTYLDANLASHAFIRHTDGSFETITQNGADFPAETAYINDGGELTGFTPQGAYVRSSRGVITMFAVPMSIGTYPIAINSSGTITGYYLKNARDYGSGFTRDADGIISEFKIGQVETYPVGINSDGAVTGYFEVDDLRVAFIRHSSGRVETFQAPGSIGFGTIATAINDSGAITGNYTDLQGQHGFIQGPQGNFASFDASGPTVTTSTTCINASGAVAGIASTNTTSEGFLRKPDGTVIIFRPSQYANITNPSSINASGQVTGGFIDIAGTLHGFLLTP